MRILIACLACLMLVSPACGDPMDSLITQLGSQDFGVRQRASRLLADDETLTLRQIEEVLASRTLGAEQRRRLLNAAQQRFDSGPRAAMGVRFGGNLRQSRIVIGATFEQFPSHRVLEVGDIIVEADGIPLRGDRSWPTLRSLIISRDPGDAMPVKVRRGAELIPLNVTLGSFSNLPGSVLSKVDLLRAWTIRSARYNREITDNPISVNLPASVWRTNLAKFGDKRKLQMMRRNGPPAVVAGGQPRAVNTRRPAERASVDARLRVQQRQPVVRPEDVNVFQIQPPTLTLQEELERLNAIEQSLERQVRDLDMKLEGAKPGTADSLSKSLIDRRQDLVILQKERAAIEAEIAEQAAAVPHADPSDPK